MHNTLRSQEKMSINVKKKIKILLIVESLPYNRKHLEATVVI